MKGRVRDPAVLLSRRRMILTHPPEWTAMTRNAIPRCLLVAVGFVWCSTLALVPPGSLTAQDDASRSTEEVSRWIEELDADEFLTREFATESLVEVGLPAIQPLVDSLRQNRREINTRAVYILQQMALSSEPDLEEEARRALVLVALSDVRSAARQAAETLAGIDEVRQQRALVELVRLGAKTLPERGQFNFMANGLEIGDDWIGTDRDLRQIRWLQDLQYVTYTGDRATDEWLEHLLELPNLSYLVIKRTSVTDQGMEIIGRLKQLRLIELRYLNITDRSVPHLAQLVNTSQFRLYGTKISSEGAEKLREEVPGAEVDHRLGAFLGIGGDFHPLGCLIVEVRPGTAAAAGGLQSNDVIVSYNGERVSGFPELTALISVNVPGDQVKVAFLRHAESRKGSRPIREGDQLGITGEPHPLGCQVTEVHDNSVAKIMGMEPGDVITRFNGQIIDEPATLEALFEAARIGENASFEFLRRVDLREVEVTLGMMD
jgi:hypothetical protein